MRVIARAKAVAAGEDGFGLVETLIALTILVVGLIAVSGLSLASADQARIANWRSQQAAAAQIVLEDVQSGGFDAATSKMDTANVGGRDFVVKVDVSEISTRVKQVNIAVAGVGEVGSVEYSARLYRPRPLPDPLPVTP